MIHHEDDWLTIHGGDVREVLPTLPSASVDCIVTSPPYWGLRDYGSDGQLGLEATPEEYVANLVGVFRELRRVLKPSGTCWLNLGDSYSAGTMSGKVGPDSILPARVQESHGTLPPRSMADLAPKQLVGIPWRVAFALQADGWWLRSDIIWAKPNPMPESVTDRPTKAHEYLFLLTKSARYYYDAEAVAEASVFQPGSREDVDRGGFGGKWAETNGKEAFRSIAPTRNLRSVWTIATRPYPGAHFAVFPPELPERCIKAGSSERGVCPECGAPWGRVVERQNESTYSRIQRETGTTYKDMKAEAAANGITPGNVGGTHAPGRRGAFYEPPDNKTTGWAPSCAHTTLKPTTAVILDPFAGSGTVGLVANRLSRRAILIDLNPAYLEQQMSRNAQIPVGL